MALEATTTGFGLALVGSAFAFGFRHGFDWDHIAAITDITSSQRSRRAGLRFATLYAAGHGVVVFAIGVVAIIAGRSIPDGVDAAMGRVVGVTLVVLGLYVIYALVRHRRGFRLRSRWMLVFSGAGRAYRWLRSRLRSGEPVEHAHAHVAGGPYAHHDDPAEPSTAVSTHAHPHRHTDPFTDYGTGTSLAVGALHGVGAETPTQVVIFLAAAGAGGAWAGVTVLAVFLVGLFAANTMLAVASASGFLAADNRFWVYATISVIAAVGSLVLGTLLIVGADDVIPALF